MSTAENLDNKIKKFWPKSGPAIQEIGKYDTLLCHSYLDIIYLESLFIILLHNC